MFQLITFHGQLKPQNHELCGSQMIFSSKINDLSMLMQAVTWSRKPTITLVAELRMLHKYIMTITANTYLGKYKFLQAMNLCQRELAQLDPHSFMTGSTPKRLNQFAFQGYSQQYSKDRKYILYDSELCRPTPNLTSTL